MYVLGNPLKYTDPTGHEICMDDGNCKKTVTPEMILAKYGVKLENGSKTWTTKDKLAVLKGVGDVARHFGAKIGDTAVNAFRDIFNTSSTPMVFLMGNTGSQFGNDGTGGNKYCDIGSGGCNVGATHYKDTGQVINLIKFKSLSPVLFRARNNVVHELGHAFYNAIGTPMLGNSFSRDALIRNQTVGGKEVLEWEQHPGADGSELFADTFLAWTYNAWNPLNVDAVTLAQNAMNGIPLP